MRAIKYNPYNGVNWSHKLKSELHSHTTESDGSNTPAEMIEEYNNQGFDVVAITDHDWKVVNDEAVAIPTTWPWSDYGITDEIRGGIFPIQGCEAGWHLDVPSKQKHIISLFSDYAGDKDATDEKRFNEIKSKGGIVAWAHPGTFYSMRHYDSVYRDRLPLLFGQEIGNGYSQLSSGWESINLRSWAYSSQRIPQRITALSNSDAHNTSMIGREYNILICEKSMSSIRDAIIQGRLLVTRVYQGESDVGHSVNSIKTTNDVITINSIGADSVLWIGNYGTGSGTNWANIAEGSTFDAKQLSEEFHSFFAVVQGGSGAIFTNSFVMGRERWPQSNNFT